VSPLPFQKRFTVKYVHNILIFAALVAVWPALRAWAADAPTSRDELVKRLTKALKAKEKDAIMGLFDWQGVSQDVKTAQEMMIAMMFEQEVKSVEPSPLPEGYPLKQTRDGVQYRPNIAVVGLIKVTFTEEDNPMRAGFAYGTKSNAFYLATLIEDKAAAAATNAVANPR